MALPLDSQEFLMNLRTDKRFDKLLSDIQASWIPSQGPTWTPEKPISNKERIFYEARQQGFNTLISLLLRGQKTNE